MYIIYEGPHRGGLSQIGKTPVDIPWGKVVEVDDDLGQRVVAPLVPAVKGEQEEVPSPFREATKEEVKAFKDAATKAAAAEKKAEQVTKDEEVPS
jgi:hypothetical protein